MICTECNDFHHDRCIGNNCTCCCMKGQHPNILAEKKRKNLETIFSKQGVYAIRSATMIIADGCTNLAKYLNKWLESNRYGTEWR